MEKIKPKKSQQRTRGRYMGRKTPKPISVTPLHGELDPHEWHFVDVPEAELVACCYWEYMRESVALRKAVEWWRRMPKYVSGSSPSDEELLIILACYPSSNFLIELPFPNPWQSLDKNQRAKWAPHIIPNQLEVTGPPFRVIGDGTIVGEHEVGIAKELYRQTASAREKNLSKTASTANQTASLVSCVGRFSDSQFLIAEINWQNYTNVEISQFIHWWLKEHRPEHLPEPPERGKGKKPKIDYAHKLRDLGVMRLLAETQFGNMHLRQTEAWRIYGQEERNWYNRGRALENFKKLLPFAHSETPLHATTKSEREKSPE